MPIVGPQELGKIFECEDSYIHKLAKEGMPQEGRGKYDLGNCMLWYIKYLKNKLKTRARLAHDPTAPVTTERDVRLRLLTAEADLKQLELARERGQFVSLEDVEKTIMQIVVVTKARILALPSRLAAQLVGEGRLEIENRLDKELKATLTTLSKNGHEAADGNPPERID
jgi:phage terminase Nu1 subunit (DNA packaging protein)